MIQRLKKMKENKKGFTLVELIVVLVILAILIALLVPALTGYIDKARQKSVAAEARMMLEAVQVEVSDDYSKATPTLANLASPTDPTPEMIALSEVKKTDFECKYTTENGKVKTLTYSRGGHQAKYAEGTWDISKITTP